MSILDFTDRELVADLWLVAVLILGSIFLPGTFPDTGIRARWQTVITRAHSAARTLNTDLPRGIAKRKILGVTFYDDLLTGRWSSQPQQRPLYTNILKGRSLPDLRLITIVPGSNDAPVECLLFTVPFLTWAGVTDSPLRRLLPRSMTSLIKMFRKDAIQIFHKREPVGDILSWCWGDLTITESITVNGSPFSVTTNLAAALRRLRANGPTTLWVDAISINQNDEEERKVMLPLMRALYMSAKTVHCWIGEVEPVHRDRFFKALEQHERDRELLDDLPRALNELLRSGIEVTPEAIDKLTGSAPGSPGCMMAVWKGKYPLEDMQADCQCAMAITPLPYWTRKWVVQEVVLANQLEVHCGDSSHIVNQPTLLAETLGQLCSHVTIGTHYLGSTPYKGMFKTELADVHACHITLQAGADLKDLQDLSKLPRLLLLLRYSSVTKPEDGILGILALLDQFDINPQGTADDVFLSATTSIMRTTRSLELLEQARFESMPSWIPDFSTMVREDKLQDPGSAEIIARPNFMIRGPVLVTAAYKIGIVAAICQGEILSGPEDVEPHRNPTSWTRKRWELWQTFFDEHGMAQDARWSFLHQDYKTSSKDNVDTNIDLPAAEIRKTQEQVEAFMAGDETMLPARWNKHINTKTVFKTVDGKFGMITGSVKLKAGDTVYALASARVLYCVRLYGTLRSLPVGRLLGTCYVQDTWNEKPMKQAARERFGDESRINEVFDKLVVI